MTCVENYFEKVGCKHKQRIIGSLTVEGKRK